MDTRAPFDNPFPAGGASRDAVERRLESIEDRLDAIEESLRLEISRDLQAVAEEMRRSVSELGRLMLRDLDRLTRILGEHRDEIVGRLAPPPPPAWPVDVAPPAPPGADAIEVEEVAPAGVEPVPLTGEDGRWRVPGRRRRRSPKAVPADDTGRG